MVFICLAALYESWSIPLSVIRAVPVSIFGTVLTARLFGLDNDDYFKVAMLTTMGLAAKNAIGISVVGGMLAATVLGVFFVSLFFFVITKLSGARGAPGPGKPNRDAVV